jgi:hypothetical protein
MPEQRKQPTAEEIADSAILHHMNAAQMVNALAAAIQHANMGHVHGLILGLIMGNGKFEQVQIGCADAKGVLKVCIEQLEAARASNEMGEAQGNG